MSNQFSFYTAIASIQEDFDNREKMIYDLHHQVLDLTRKLKTWTKELTLNCPCCSDKIIRIVLDPNNGKILESISQNRISKSEQEPKQEQEQESEQSTPLQVKSSCPYVIDNRMNKRVGQPCGLLCKTLAKDNKVYCGFHAKAVNSRL